MPPQVLITITRHPTGADLVTLAPVGSGYTSQDMVVLCNRIGELTGDPARGVQVVSTRMGADDKLNFYRASFATSGLINRETGEFNLQTIARAVAPAPGKFTSLMVSLPGEGPNQRTIRTFANESAAMAGRFIQTPATMEYRIRLFTSDPAKIVIPSDLKAITPSRKKESVPEKRTNWPLFAIIGMCSVGVGLLVYSRLLAIANLRKR
ncbi:MAG: hypothetical protein JNJ45_03210 [Chthonomonas sp.]|nr:hypothetical protein [Chthonomonas sp.]